MFKILKKFFDFCSVENRKKILCVHCARCYFSIYYQYIHFSFLWHYAYKHFGNISDKE